EKIILKNVNGQRYVSTGLQSNVKIEINGVPGNDLGAFMDGPQIKVFGNAQEAVGNTMNNGRISIYGSAGDILGYAMRGGEIFVRENVGYRVGIHMKAYQNLLPVIVIGGTTQDYLGEYMAGGILIVLAVSNQPVRSNFIGTGMHGGTIYIRGELERHQLGREVGIVEMTSEDRNILNKYTGYYCKEFKIDNSKGKLLKGKFLKIVPVSHRPYGNLYAY
ncbi:MAG: hypothetical protein AB1633_05110, partial [Elusimicrobiota bacterium]